MLRLHALDLVLLGVDCVLVIESLFLSVGLKNIVENAVLEDRQLPHTGNHSHT